MGIILTKNATIASLNSKIDQVRDVVNAQLSTVRAQASRIGAMLGLSHEGKRNLYTIYGYDDSLGGTAGFDKMYRYSRREGISNRVSWGVAKSSWRDGFDIYTGPEKEATQILQDEITDLAKAGLHRKIERADILNRIGRFSVLFVGVPDGRQPNEEIGKVAGNPDAILDKLYFVPYAYDGIEITKQVTDPTDPRFGLPELYQLQRQNRGDTEKDIQASSIIVHWSRIIHLNENALDSDIEGMGALEPIFNRILDLDKTCGGSAEAYFRNAKGKIAYEIDKEFASTILTNPEAKEKFQEGAEKFTNEYQDFTVAAGATIKTIDTPHDSPLDTVKVLLWSISGYSGIPLRVLTGEGAGQLAGSEDQLAYNQLIKDRQRLVCTPWLVRFFDILQAAGMLSELPEKYDVRFPVQEAATSSQKAETGNKVADTILKVVSAKSQIGGDGLDLDSAFAEVGLEAVKIEEPDIDDLENPDDNTDHTEEPEPDQ